MKIAFYFENVIYKTCPIVILKLRLEYRMLLIFLALKCYSVLCYF